MAQESPQQPLVQSWRRCLSFFEHAKYESVEFCGVERCVSICVKVMGPFFSASCFVSERKSQ